MATKRSPRRSADLSWTTLGGRLRWAREHADLTREAVEATSGIKLKTLASWESGSRSKRNAIDPDSVMTLARVYKVDPAWLALSLGRPLPGRNTMRAVAVTGDLQAGLWRESFAWDDDRHFDVFVPESRRLRGATLYAAEVRGTSMDRVYPEGTIVVLKRIVAGIEDLEEGKRYHVDREQADGRLESTLKTVRRRADGSLWLQPESSDPAFQQAIRFDGERGLQVVGRVVHALTTE